MLYCKFFKLTLLIFFLISHEISYASDRSGFTQEDRERLIRLEATLQTYMQVTDKRFEDMNKRFEDMNKRFEDVNSRIDDLNRRMDEFNKRFDQLITILGIIVGMFTMLIVFMLGLIYWDRRTFIRRAREEVMEKLEKEYRISDLRKLLYAMRELSKEDPRVEKVLKSLNLL